jgi:phospholipase C
LRHIFRILLLVSTLVVVSSQAQISQFQHIIVVVQENRTPDNLFYELCASSPCSTNPNNTQYNIQTSNWLDKTSPSGFTQPKGVGLASRYSVTHSHPAWENECDLNENTNQCRMDGAALTSVNRGAFAFVNNTVNSQFPNGVLTPYLTMVAQYGWANYMFQTNQGPSFPAHQFIFGGTSALDASGDAEGTFLSENPSTPTNAGCYAQNGEQIHLIDSAGVEDILTIDYASGVTICLTRTTMADVLDNADVGWKYYSTKGGGTDHGGDNWTAPNAIEWICSPNADHKSCTGSEWANHVEINPPAVLTDMGVGDGYCNLQGVSWVIPTGTNSDHGASWGGPDWVASIVNALGNSPCVNPDGSSYWDTTAVLITWDDWGGWYDHVPPAILPFPQGGYQLGFRVPLVFVSAYTPAAYIDNQNYDFGSVLRFIENNFNLGEGVLGFADSRASTDFSAFYNLNMSPRPFRTIPTMKTGIDFINDKTPPTDPDDD